MCDDLSGDVKAEKYKLDLELTDLQKRAKKANEYIARKKRKVASAIELEVGAEVQVEDDVQESSESGSSDDEQNFPPGLPPTMSA